MRLFNNLWDLKFVELLRFIAIGFYNSLKHYETYIGLRLSNSLLNSMEVTIPLDL